MQVEVLVELLRTLGAAATATTHFGSSALHFAAVGGHVAAVRALLEMRADVHAQDSQGTALHSAAREGHDWTLMQVRVSSRSEV
jgi:ankyrin repeat protein